VGVVRVTWAISTLWTLKSFASASRRYTVFPHLDNWWLVSEDNPISQTCWQTYFFTDCGWQSDSDKNNVAQGYSNLLGRSRNVLTSLTAKCKKTEQFKTSCKDDCGWITQLKQQISKRRYYLAAYRPVVNVLTSNSAFLIFAVLVVWSSHSRPYKMF